MVDDKKEKKKDRNINFKTPQNAPHNAISR